MPACVVFQRLRCRRVLGCFVLLESQADDKGGDLRLSCIPGAVFRGEASGLIAVIDLLVFLQVVMIDLVLAGDNAVVIGLASANLPDNQRSRAILVGIIAATVLRIVFAALATQLLQIVGLLLAGGILLLWVCWKMWRELQLPLVLKRGKRQPKRKTFPQAVLQIIIADVSMSLDNVLAVAGAAREHPVVMIFGLILSISLMGVAANFVAKLLQRQRWIAYVGLAIILYVAFEMVYRGAGEVNDWGLT
jgi:YjbE family integral membrane protein